MKACASRVGSGHGFYVLVEAHGTDEIDRSAAVRSAGWGSCSKRLVAGRGGGAVGGRHAGVLGVRDACAEFYQPPVIGPHLAFDIGLAVDAMDALSRRSCKAALAAVHPRLPERVLRPHRRRQHALLGLGAGLPVEQQPKEAVDEVIYGLVRDITAASRPSTASAR